jgi:hypothetical protein
MIEKGEIVTCENGHEICEVSTDLYRTSPVNSSDFINFKNGIQPVQHQRVDENNKCTICDAEWIRINLYQNIQFHTKKGWWPSKGE